MMHAAWLQSNGKLDNCPVCIDEHGNPDNPNYQPIDILAGAEQTSFPLPCPKHGDPAICLPGNEDAFEIYRLININKAYRFREEAQGEKTILKADLDLTTCVALCKEWPGVQVREMLPKLTIIHEWLFN
jgi:hypothetical protein